MAMLLNGRKFVERVIRKVVLNYIPSWAFNSAFAKTASYRPQVAWFPQVKRGNRKVLLQHFEKGDGQNAVHN
ncbi:hypothetical protein BGZ76_001229 [Entomortierella beljakovae]|nr:hypothetical protein BGZ76_001229 [Entomortierella beljakovae]